MPVPSDVHIQDTGLDSTSVASVVAGMLVPHLQNAACPPVSGRVHLRDASAAYHGVITEQQQLVGPLMLLDLTLPHSAGPEVSAALSADGRAWLWGFGTNSQLGNGSDDSDREVPSLLQGRALQGKRVMQVGGPSSASLK